VQDQTATKMVEETTTTSFSSPEQDGSGKVNKAYSEDNEYAVQIEFSKDSKKEGEFVDITLQQDGVRSDKTDGDVDADADDEEDVIDEDASFILKLLLKPIFFIKGFFSKYDKEIGQVIGVIFALGVTAYLVAAMVRNFDRAVTLLVIWSLVVGYSCYAFIVKNFGKNIKKFLDPLLNFVDNNMSWIKWIFILLVIAGLATWIALDTSKRPDQLVSGAGYFVFIFGLFLTSKHPSKVRWRTILWGGLIQLCMGMFILRTTAGFEAFNWTGMITQTFINYVDVGVEFVFGATWADHSFAFKTLSVVIYFSAFISIMYHLGVMQWLILKIAWIMQKTLSTSATESMVAAGNIFVGQTESPLLIRPYINDLTTSELFAVMVCGFGTISGSVLGAYLGFGIEPSYVITACVMAAPCALAVAKLQYPETKVSKFSDYKDLVLDDSGHRNFIEAAFSGVSAAIPLVLNIGANLVAFLGLLAAVNGFLNWFGGLLDFSELSFELMCSYVFLPVTFFMGIEWQDCFKAAELIGVKIFLNEFIAYEDLSEMLVARDNGTIPKLDPVTGDVNWVDERTEAIITYALCGFANVGSIGIVLGGLGAMAPKRQGEMASIIFRAMMCGIFVSILNACVAGFLYVPRPIKCTGLWNVDNGADWMVSSDRLIECCRPLFAGTTKSSTLCCQYDWTNTNYASDASSCP